jgi:phosphoribosylaminoimidazolecarboxamide formyltransferase/IMP cyclohydrolase
MIKIQRAIISVTDKTGVAEFARELTKMGVEILSTGGTEKLIREAGIDVTPISAHTGFPEMLDGRVKTLHPKVHGGLLGVRDNPAHKEAMETHEIPPIDMVVVNLYRFEETIAKGASFEDAIENIDIGGPSMLRSAAKNHKFVAAVTDPDDYARIIEEMRGADGSVSAETNLRLAKKVFALTARYDGAISNYLGGVGEASDSAFPDTITRQFNKLQGLRYGENPHQAAAYYIDPYGPETTLANAKKLHGKELSYNNILDLDSCAAMVHDFTDPVAVLVKHNNPCGVATSKSSLSEAYDKALSCDSTSAFGGIFGFNGEVTMELAEKLKPIFFEAIIAPSFNDDALKLLMSKKNLRILHMPSLATRVGKDAELKDIPMQFKSVSGGILMQEADKSAAMDLKTVTKRAPTEEELEDLIFAWNVAKHVKSNAIILAKNAQTIGIGAGQMSRIDSTKLSVMKAESAELDIKGTVLSSDAFFPFRDNVDLAAEHGIRAIIQPGGSIRDSEVIAAADENDIAMVFTDTRHFRH